MAFLKKRGPYYWIITTSREQRLGFKPFSTKETNQRIASLLLTEYKNKMRLSPQPGSPTPVNLIGLDESLKLYFQERATTNRPYNQLTKENYLLAVKLLKECCGDKPLRDFTRTDYHSFVDFLGSNSQNTKSIRTKSLFALFSWLVKEEYISKNPMKRIMEENKPIRIHTKQEVKELLTYSEKTEFNFYVRFQIVSAFRMHEILKLTPADFREGNIFITGKGNKHSSIPITSKMDELLKIIPMPDNKKERIFSFSKDSVWRFFQRASKQIKIKFKSHDLRKYCLSELANSGVPINFTARYGRITINTAMKYYVSHDIKRIGEMINEKVSFY